MKPGYAVVGSALFLAIAPGTIAGLIPWWFVRWPAPLSPAPLAILGGMLLAGGGLLLLECFGRFALVGRGTPAPVAPTERLVVSGAYRRVRNPMYVAVLALVLGQAALFGSWQVLAYAVALWVCFHLFVLAYEEPTLRHDFPQDYVAYVAAVPRWIPRLRPWKG